MAPIADMTTIAASISAEESSSRLDIDRTPRELQRLASTLNQAFDRLTTAFEQQKRFTADASHELRTPLSVVQTESELALKRERTPDEYRASLRTILRAAERMGGLVEGLLRLARGDAGAAGTLRQPVELGMVVRECLSSLGSLAAGRQVQLRCENETVTVDGDFAALEIVFSNLIRNAIQHSPSGGQVTAEVRAEAGQGRVVVRDDGAGIATEDLARVFDRFYRADPARSRGGAGLGLSIARQIVIEHGGTIAAANGPTGGAIFTVTLPRA